MTLQYVKPFKNYGIVGKNKELVIELFKNGNSAYRISKILGCAKTSVLKKLRQWGFSEEVSKKSTVDKNNLLKDKKDLVIKLFKEGQSCNEIAKITGHKGGGVFKLLNKYGYDTSNWKYNVDETFFKNINTQEKAYILGWMYSDGNVMPEGKFRITIHNKDREILEKIRKIIKYDGPIYDWPKKNQVELCINRKSMTDDLYELGCYPNKSMSLKLPSSKQIPENLFNHFLRGYFDGDGSIRVVNNKIKYVNIVGSYNFIYGLSRKISFKHKIYQRYKKRPIRESSHQLFFLRQSESKSFLKYLYGSSTISLKRKFDISSRFLI